MSDLRRYDYFDNEPLITTTTQIKDYLDGKFSNIKVEVSDEKLDNIIDNINSAKSEIIYTVEESKPCLCNLATKKDVCEAKCAILKKISSSEENIIKEIDENFVDLNEVIKNLK